MNKQSIMKSLRYAHKLVSGSYRSIAPAYSTDEVQTAVGIIDKLNAPTMDAFDEQHIVTVGTAYDMMLNAYWKTGAKGSLVQAKDLKEIQLTSGSAYVKYHITPDPFNHTYSLSCTLLNVADLEKLISSVKHDLKLDQSIQYIKVPDKVPF